LRSEVDFEDEKNMAERAIGLLTRRYDSKCFPGVRTGDGSFMNGAVSRVLIDTTSYTEELVGWSPVYNHDSEMPPWFFGGNTPIGQEEALWHPTKEAVALSVSVSRRATSVWIGNTNTVFRN